MDVEQAFLSSVILDGDTAKAVKARITLDFFNDDKWKRVYEYILDHWRKYAQPADEAVVHDNFPSYRWESVPYSLDYLVDALRVRRAKSIALDGLNSAAALVTSSDSADVWKMLDIMREATMQARIETAPALDIEHAALGKDHLEMLEARMDDPGYLRGISTGFKGIDFVTGGLQPEQLVVLIGLPKSLKSATLLYMALAVQKQARLGLFLGFEMSNTEQSDRMASLLSGVALTKILNGTVSVREADAVEKAWKLQSEMRALILSSDITNAMTVSGIQGKIMEYDPDVVFIDSAYLMQSEAPKVEQGSAQALADIARGLKKLAQSQHIPIVVTTQATSTRARGGKLNADSAMYTQAWRQSADVLLGCERIDPSSDAEPDDEHEVPIMLKVLATRSGPRTTTAIVWDWSRGQCVEVDMRGAPSGP